MIYVGGQSKAIPAWHFNENHDESGRFASGGSSALATVQMGGLEYSQRFTPSGVSPERGSGQPINAAKIVGSAGVRTPEAVRMKDGAVYIGESHYDTLSAVFEDGYKPADVRSYGYYHKATSEFFPLHTSERYHAQAMLTSAWHDHQQLGYSIHTAGR